MSLDVDAQPWADADGQRLVHRGHGGFQSDLRVGGRCEGDGRAGVADGAPRVGGQAGGVDQGHVRPQ
jgi:hypothetical protein